MAYKAELKAELDELVENDIIAPVSKPTSWCSPIVVTNNKNSEKVCLCVDFRQLNRLVARELYHHFIPHSNGRQLLGRGSVVILFTLNLGLKHGMVMVLERNRNISVLLDD